MDILQISSECAPYAKTGGLADVVGALGPTLGRRGHRCLTVLPRYHGIDLAELGADPIPQPWGVHSSHTRHDVKLYRLQRESDVVVFVEHPMFSGRAGIYGDARGSFGDNHIRFLVLCHAALAAARFVRFDDDGPLGEDIVVHAHDWHAALAPLILAAQYRPLGLFPRAPSILTVHNIAHQGRMSAELFNDLELPPRWMGPWALEWYGDLNLMKAGLLHADLISTVSPTFAREIQGAEGGFGLDPLLRSRADVLTGILNGIDTTVWNAEHDPHLEAGFTADDLSGKAVCKASIQAELGLPVDPDAPLLGSVGRLDPQKGIDLITESIPWMVEQGAQVILLGSASPTYARYEHELRQLERRYPRNVRAWMGFSERMAHVFEAGCDIFLMPSRFEPCGLNQMYSMAYGTVPVARSTGGLTDSVKTPEEVGDQATGFRFRPYTGFAFREAIWRALRLYRHDRPAFKQLQRNGMRTDWSWDAAVVGYEELYRRGLALRGLEG